MTNQLTLLFLVVVISGALCTVEDYVIMSQCAHNKAIYLAAEGTVSVTDISQTQNITIVGRPDFVNNNFKIALYAKETQRYLCFNDHWKLVGMKELQDTCYFNEAILHGYFVFRSVVDQHRRIGFTQRGRAVGPKKTVNDACYMFTKIPTDQFFHQHNHFSAASKTRASTRTPPLTEEHSGGGGHLGRGSGGGRPNRHRNHQRSEESSRQHAKKTKVHNSGTGGINSRKRQHQQQQQQRLQQMRGGHSGGGDPKNSTYLNSSRQNIELSQYGGGGGHQNHTGKHHNHSQPQYHQTRHHHNNESRRHHHEQQKQKTRTHHRVRTTSPTTRTTTTAKTTTSMPTRTTATSTTSSTPKALDIKPTSVLPTLTSTVITAPTTTTTTTTTTSSTTHSSHDVLAATSVAHKRKGRRRKPHRKHTFHKSESSGHSAEISSHSSRHGHGHAATLPSYDDEDYITTDYTTWMNGDISSAMGLAAANSLKPTSATLPSWESWYPSSATPPLEEEGNKPDSPYSSTSVSSLDKEASSSSLPSHYDLSKNRETLMPLPFPTTAFFAATSSHDNTLEEDEAIAPTVTLEDLTTSSKTINTSIFKNNENWLRKSQHRNGDEEEEKEEEREEDELVTKLALDLEEELNMTREHERLENSTTSDTLWSSSSESEVDDDDDEETSEEASGEMAADGTTLTPKVNDELPYVTPTKSTEPQAAAPSTNKLMTDYLYATRTAPITGPHKVSRHRHGGHDSSKHPHNAMHQHHNDKGGAMHHKLKANLKTTSQEPITTSSSSTSTISTSSTTAATTTTRSTTTTHWTRDNEQSDLLLAGDKQINTQQSHHNTVTDMEMQDSHLSSTLSTALLTSSALPSVATTTTRKALRKSTQRLLATPFHQLTYVRNDNGDIDIDNLDNISMYPDLMDNENINHHLKRDEEHHHQKSPGNTSRFTMITGYQQPSAATSALPESIRIAKIKINRERKRMLRLRNIGGYNA